jgi:hypothetical protein
MSLRRDTDGLMVSDVRGFDSPDVYRYRTTDIKCFGAWSDYWTRKIVLIIFGSR